MKTITVKAFNQTAVIEIPDGHTFGESMNHPSVLAMTSRIPLRKWERLSPLAQRIERRRDEIIPTDVSEFTVELFNRNGGSRA